MNDITQLQQENEALKQQLCTLQAKYDSILEQFKLSQQRQYSPSSEKNVLQQELFDEAGIEETLGEEYADQEQSIEVPAHKRTQPKRQPLPDHCKLTARLRNYPK